MIVCRAFSPGDLPPPPPYNGIYFLISPVVYSLQVILILACVNMNPAKYEKLPITGLVSNHACRLDSLQLILHFILVSFDLANTETKL